MRPNILWRNNSHHKPTFSYPYIGTSLVGGIQAGFSIDKTSTWSFTFTSFSINHLSQSSHAPIISPRNKQSNKKSWISSNKNKIPFHHYYADLPRLLFLILALSNLVSFSSDLLGDLNNYTPANLKYFPTQQARMIFLICIFNSMVCP